MGVFENTFVAAAFGVAPGAPLVRVGQPVRQVALQFHCGRAVLCALSEAVDDVACRLRFETRRDREPFAGGVGAGEVFDECSARRAHCAEHVVAGQAVA